MDSELVIFGAGGLAREMLNTVFDANAAGEGQLRFRGFIADPAPDPEILDRLAVDYLGKPDPRLMSTLAGVSFLVGIGDVTVRRRVFEEAVGWGLTPTTIVHPSAVVGRDVDLQSGVMIQAGVMITTNISIGTGTLVNLGCTIGHDTIIGAFCALAPHVSISGRCVIAEQVDVGTAATVLPDRSIGKGARIGAGAVVTKDVPAGVTVVGVPARPLPA